MYSKFLVFVEDKLLFEKVETLTIIYFEFSVSNKDELVLNDKMIVNLERYDRINYFNK